MNIKNMDYILITGATGCGKSSLLESFMKNYPNDVELLKKWTTRPIRDSERKSDPLKLEYYFVQDEEINQLTEDGMLLYNQAYQTAHGLWRYGVPKYNSPKRDKVYIQVLGTDDIFGMVNMKENWFPENSILINIQVDKCSTLKKLKIREDDEESKRRVEMNFDTCGYSKTLDDLRENPIINDGYTTWDEFKLPLIYHLTKNIFKNKNSLFINIENPGYILSPDDISRLIYELDASTLDRYISIDPDQIVVKGVHNSYFDTKNKLSK